jgi:diacylglycerol kinase (ATP)
MRVILNPSSRHGAGRRMRSVIERGLARRGIDFDIVETEAGGHAETLARDAAEAGVGVVVAAGGDGTVHEVANGLMSADRTTSALGLIPIGTGNDFVKMFPGTGSVERALDTLASGATVESDVGVAAWDGRTEYFVNAMGTGIDVEVVRQMRRSRLLPGMAIYLSALVRALARYRPLPISITVDGAGALHRIMNLAVCNGPSIGGSFRICPAARTDDGILDVCVIDAMPLHRNVRMVPRVLRGTHAGQPEVTMLRGRSVTLQLGDGSTLPFQLDGELREARDAGGVAIMLAPRRLRVVCSRTNP